MSTAVLDPVPQPAATHPSFLKEVGHLSREVVTKLIPEIVNEAHASEPIVDLLFPVQGPLFNAVVNAVMMVEVETAQASADQTTGPAKFQAVLAKVGPQLEQVATSQGLLGPVAAAAIQRYVQAVFDLLDGPAK